VTQVAPVEPGSTRFSLVLPASWTVLDLDPATRDRSIERRIRAAVGTADSLAQFRRSAVRLYRTMLRDATDAGAFLAATLSQQVGGRPLSASLLAFLGMLPIGEDELPLSIEDMVAALSQPTTGETLQEEPAIVELPIGRSVRTRVRGGSGMSGSDGREALVDLVRFFVPVPEWGLMLVMAFSTPILPASDAFADLFDQLALTARWQS
jgi:hypothetical protein